MQVCCWDWHGVITSISVQALSLLQLLGATVLQVITEYDDCFAASYYPDRDNASAPGYARESTMLVRENVNLLADKLRDLHGCWERLSILSAVSTEEPVDNVAT